MGVREPIDVWANTPPDISIDIFEIGSRNSSF